MFWIRQSFTTVFPIAPIEEAVNTALAARVYGFPEDVFKVCRGSWRMGDSVHALPSLTIEETTASVQEAAGEGCQSSKSDASSKYAFVRLPFILRPRPPIGFQCRFGSLIGVESAEADEALQGGELLGRPFVVLLAVAELIGETGFLDETAEFDERGRFGTSTTAR
jgi:hypothetical protein